MGGTADIVIIGAGIAGASLGACLANDRSVVLLEREEQAGYHSTSRSAATYVPTYGPPAIIALTRASGPFFRQPPQGFAEADLLTPRGILMLAWPGDEAHVEEMRGLGLVEIGGDEARRRVPPLRTHGLLTAMIEENAQDIDVDALHQGFLRKLRSDGGEVVLNAAVSGITRKDGDWSVATTGGTWSAPVVVNAAGAWADEIAGMAGVRPIGLQPKRRSAALVSPPQDWDVMAWPLVFGAGETFYFKPMGGKLMVSPADTTPVEPHDAWGDDLLIAEAIERFQNAIDFEVTRLDSTWGGLRSFAPDGDPVCGFDPEAEGFFWLAGQGGYGIQTSPALSRVAAALIDGKDVPADIAGEGVTRDALSPARLAQ